MQRMCRWWLPLVLAALAVALIAFEPSAQSACCYFSAKDQDILQPSQKVFITWDPQRKLESFTVQPRFEGSARDFGMVIPTPAKPKLDEMPRDFFKELAVFSILKRREFPQSKLVAGFGGFNGGIGGYGGGFAGFAGLPMAAPPRAPAVKVLETGVVGSLDYKIIDAKRADDLYTWLKDNKYHYAGDEATLDFYVKKNWIFTVMKIDTMQMKRNPDGSFAGEVTPTRFQFTSDQLIYPLKITQLSVKDRTEALFYVQAPYKVDLPEDMTYQYQWLPMLQNAQGWYAKGTFGTNDLPGKADGWLKAVKKQTPQLLQRAEELGFKFVSGQRPKPNRDGHIATTLEWAKRLTATEIKLFKDSAVFSEQVPDVDFGFTAADLADPRKGPAAARVIQQRLDNSRRRKPGGYLVREAPAEDVRQLKILAGHLQEGQFLTKFRKTFTTDEMERDLLLVPARLERMQDMSEYEEALPTSPP